MRKTVIILASLLGSLLLASCAGVVKHDRGGIVSKDWRSSESARNEERSSEASLPATTALPLRRQVGGGQSQ